MRTSSSLVELNLSMNQIHGKLPNLSSENSSSAIIDLTSNHLSGNNLSGKFPRSLGYLMNIISLRLHDNSFSGEFPYLETCTELVGVDLGAKKLSGKILAWIDQSLSSMELNSHNLSRNNLWGELTENFGQLKMLESLDLSRNQLSGRIPSSFSSLNFLSVLDLSYNNLSGRTPLSAQLQSFNSSQYMGNLGLCGPPVTQKCPGD
ncbi:hypothetical protein PRUPE_5G052000 [Prunus persica]|uniref:Leucine-rich repeat-containing N-terminal plant-type domain-containing protein n=1 Tax=Prunus persica TaxID=3760 RepID=A0A251P5I7_PRUPE|nr:hypothetical protein PRUPE_5G052000 [Prunus persica]